MPIISPWTFYLINLVDGALIIFVIIFVFCAVAAGVTGLAYFDAPDDELEEGAKKWLKRFVIGAIISLIMIIVIPSKETCYQMLAAKMVTYENVGLAVGKIKEIALFLMNGAK